MKANIAGAEVDCYSFDEVVDLTLRQALTETSPKYIVTPNAQHINNLQGDSLFRKIYSQAFLVIPDGVSIVWAANFLKTPVKGKISGINLFEKLCERGASKQLKIFLLGGRPQAAERAAEILEQRYRGLKIAGTYCPSYGFESDPLEIDRINQKILDAAPNLLFVGLGSPKQEKWIYNHYRELNVPVSIGIGVSFEFVAGNGQKSTTLDAGKWLGVVISLNCRAKAALGALSDWQSPFYFFGTATKIWIGSQSSGRN